MPLAAVLVLAAATLVFRLVGPLTRHRRALPARAERLMSDAAVVLLVALVAVTAFTDGQSFAGAARP
ncbi:MAG: AzlD domain-containing protein, partial [Nocardioidaceae bacterium]|nr:AzlD domain-containing protein [Nocardioidaceae bacterium]